MEEEVRADARDPNAAPVAGFGRLDRAGPLQQVEELGRQRLAREGQAPAEDIAQGPGALLVRPGDDPGVRRRRDRDEIIVERLEAAEQIGERAVAFVHQSLCR